MSFTAAWLLGIAYLLVVEMLAVRSGEYGHTATGHLVRVMLVHPAIAVLLLSAVFAGLVHLLIDYVTRGLR